MNSFGPIGVIRAIRGSSPALNLIFRGRKGFDQIPLQILFQLAREFSTLVRYVEDVDRAVTFRRNEGDFDIAAVAGNDGRDSI